MTTTTHKNSQHRRRQTTLPFTSSSSSSGVFLWTIAVALSSLSFPSFVADAWILKSTGTGGWATGLAYSHDDKSYLIAGTLYTNEFWDLTLLGGSNSTEHKQCFVVQAAHDNSATVMVSRRVAAALQSPQVCVGGAVQVSHGNNGFAGVLGTNQNGDASLQMLTQQSVGTAIEPSSSLALPTATIPVASTSMENQYVFVAMHKSMNYPAFQISNSRFNDLNSLVDYWDILTQAPVNNDYVEIVKFDSSTLEEDFLSRLELSAGSAVVSALETYTSPTNSNDDKILLIAGSTNGVGDAFGIASDGAGAYEWDGYLTWVDANTGIYEHSKRLDVLPGSDDFVNDICVEGDIVYVVGFSRQETVLYEVDMTFDTGFLIAIDINTHEELWEVEMDGQPVKCVAGGGSVYVGRYVSKVHYSDSLPVPTQNIILSKYETSSESSIAEKWSKEIDTTTDAPTDIRDDYLVDLVLATHEAGGLVALINSLDATNALNDVILLDFLRVSGRNDLTDPELNPGFNPDNEDLPGGIGRPGNDIAPPGGPTRAPISAPTTVGGGVPTLSPEEIEEEETRYTVIYLAVFVPALFGMWVVAYHFACNKSSEKEAVSPRSRAAAAPAPWDKNDLSATPTSSEETTTQREIV